MNKEQLRMQMLAGIITESEYKAKLKEQPEVMEPDTDIEIDTDKQTSPPKRRKLYNPKTSPDTKPKAIFTENENNILDKILNRFTLLKK